MKIKDLFKKYSLPIGHIFAFMVFIGIGDWLSAKDSAPNYPTLLLSGFSIWLASLTSLVANLDMRPHYREPSFGGLILAMASLFGALSLLVTGCFLIVHSTNPAINPEMAHRQYTIFWLSLACIATNITAFFSYWTKFTVRDDHRVLLGDKVLYPGMSYRLYPFFKYEVEVVPINPES